jgi:tetratricopeptide (TPR) repeat protein
MNGEPPGDAQALAAAGAQAAEAAGGQAAEAAGGQVEETAEAWQERARRALAAGDRAAAVAGYRQAIARNPRLGHSWHELAVCLGEDGAWEAVCGLADRAAPLFESPLVFFQNVALDLMERGAFAALAGLAERVPADRHYSPVALYYAGTSRLAARDYRGALAFFARFKQRVAPRLAEYPAADNHNFNLIYRQGTLVEPPDVVARIAATPPPPGSEGRPLVVWQRPWQEPEGAQVFVCALNNLYFLRFAEGLAASFRRHRPGDLLHFHIVEADPACAALVTRLRAEEPGLRLNVSVERRPPWPHGVYYTCDRFLILPQLFRRYRVPRLITLDADSELLNDLADFLPALENYDFAAFNTGRTEPASVWQATVMMFADTPAGQRLVELLRRFVLLKLDQPPILTWMLDQAALFSVLCFLDTEGSGLRLGELDRITGRALRDYIGCPASDEEKQRLMERAR